MKFNIKRDIEIVNAGGFFCEACLVGKPLCDISPDLKYCQDCYEILQEEKMIARESKDQRGYWSEKDQRGYWSEDGSLFIHYGKKYGVSKTGATVCLGDITESHQNTDISACDAQEVVTKIASKGIPLTTNSQEGILLQKKKRGRPRKTDGNVCRMTKWRREKEKQLELF